MFWRGVVGKLVGAQPPRGITPEGEIFPLAEVWSQVTGEAMPPDQSPLVPSKPARRRPNGVAP